MIKTYRFHSIFLNVVTLPEEEWIFKAFITDSQLYSPHLRRGGYFMTYIADTQL